MNQLETYLQNYAGHNMMIAFSGGVDSSLLLKAACEVMKQQEHPSIVYAVTVSTTLHPGGEVNLCASVAEEIGAVHKVVYIDELQEADILDNPVDRCYRCKHYLFARVQGLAESLECPVVFDGTNADDGKVYRPGIRAVKELGIVSPLAALDMTKAQVRALAETYGISVADRPSSPCLATRFPYGTHLTADRMHMVDAGEKYLSNLGFHNVRVRMHMDPQVDAYEGRELKTARIEIDCNKIPMFVEHRQEIAEHFRTLGFAYITLDMDGFRSGSMDQGIVS